MQSKYVYKFTLFNLKFCLVSIRGQYPLSVDKITVKFDRKHPCCYFYNPTSILRSMKINEKEVIILLDIETCTFERVAGMINESLRATYGNFLNFEVVADKVYASETRHGSALLSLNFTEKTAELLSSSTDVQSLGTVLRGLSFKVNQSHDGHEQWRL
jgi:hypothetical protein